MPLDRFPPPAVKPEPLWKAALLSPRSRHLRARPRPSPRRVSLAPAPADLLAGGESVRAQINRYQFAADSLALKYANSGNFYSGSTYDLRATPSPVVTAASLIRV